MHLGILQCDSVDNSLQPDFGDYPDMLRRLLLTDKPYSDPMFQTYNLTVGEFPESVNECDAWLITGSKWSTYDPDEWISHAQEFARELRVNRRPTVGICFGHQLICQALGGAVKKAEAGWGVGVHTTQILAQRSWMKPAQDTLSLVVSHQDQVFKAPAEAILLASHPFCPNDMLEIDKHILTLQGHPEYSKDYSRVLMNKRREIIGEPTYRKGVESLAQPVDSGIVARWILHFFKSGNPPEK